MEKMAQALQQQLIEFKAEVMGDVEALAVVPHFWTDGRRI